MERTPEQIAEAILLEAQTDSFSRLWHMEDEERNRLYAEIITLRAQVNAREAHILWLVDRSRRMRLQYCTFCVFLGLVIAIMAVKLVVG